MATKEVRGGNVDFGHDGHHDHHQHPACNQVPINMKLAANFQNPDWPV